MGNRLKIAAPLTAALILTGLFVVLLLHQAGRHGPEEPATPEAVAPQAPPPAGLLPPERIPYGTPTAPDPWKVEEPPRHGGPFYRWNLAGIDLPDDWDPEVAGRLHQLFDDMRFPGIDELEDPVIGARIARAREELEEYLASLGREALPTLATILDVEPDFSARRFVFQAAGKMGPRAEEATWVLRDYYMARQGDPSNRSEVGRVIEAMGFLRNETSFEVLTHLIDDSAHRIYRDKLIVALGEHPRREDAIDVFARGMHDPSFQTRNKSAQALGKVQSPDTLYDLYEAFDNERVWYAKQTILGSIGKIGEIDAIPFLEEQARGAPESGVRLSAASAIRRIVERTGNRTGKRVLQDLARSEPDAKVRTFIQRWSEGL